MIDNIVKAVVRAAVTVIALIFGAVCLVTFLRAGLFIARGVATFFFVFFAFVLAAKAFAGFLSVATKAASDKLDKYE
jgi:hypothetical protein